MPDNVQVKICGIKTPQAAQVAVESGASLIGLVFYGPSPRFLTLQAADELVAAVALLKKRPAQVGLFVNVPTAELAQAADRYRLDYLQLSGDESVADVIEAARIRPVIKTVRLTGPDDLEKAAQFGDLPDVTLLLDTPKAGMYGGTGEVGNWEVARTLAKHYRVLLAGGLNPANVAQAVRAVQPWGVDVSSGVEQDGAPGSKDLTKIRLFCREALGFDAETQRHREF